MEPKVTIDSNKCIHCGRCSEINEKGCLLAKSINISEGNIKNSSNMKSSVSTSIRHLVYEKMVSAVFSEY